MGSEMCIRDRGQDGLGVGADLVGGLTRAAEDAVRPDDDEVNLALSLIHI